MATAIMVDAILFDMDGTLIDSTPGVLQAWQTLSIDYNLGDSATVANSSHGRRLYDSLKELCGIDDEAQLQQEIDRFEDEVIQGGPTPLPGALSLVSKLLSNDAKWTIVTSATNKYAPRALERTGFQLPPCGIITSNDVSKGKPHPDPYLAGAALCGVEPKNCLVIEDAISGIKAGKNAGSLTLAVCTSSTRNAIIDGSNPDFIVTDLTRVTVNFVNAKLEVTMDIS